MTLSALGKRIVVNADLYGKLITSVNKLPSSWVVVLRNFDGVLNITQEYFLA